MRIAGMGRDNDGEANMRRERSQMVIAFIIALATFGCLGLVLGMYLQADSILRSGVLEVLSGENVSAPEAAIGRAILAVSTVVVWAAFALAVVWAVFTRGFFTSFTETWAEKLSEVVLVVVAVPVFVLLWGSPWLLGTIAALFFVFLGARLLMRPQDANWREGERRAYISLAGMAVFLLALQLVEILLFRG